MANGTKPQKRRIVIKRKPSSEQPEGSTSQEISDDSSEVSASTPINSPATPNEAYKYHLVLVQLGCPPRVVHYPSQDELVQHLRELVQDSASELADIRLFVFHARMLGLTALPTPFLIDAEDKIPLFDPVSSAAAELSGCLVPGVAVNEINTVVDYSAPVEDPIAEDPEGDDEVDEEEPEDVDSENGSTVDEEVGDDTLDDAVAGLLSDDEDGEEDAYGSEPVDDDT